MRKAIHFTRESNSSTVELCKSTLQRSTTRATTPKVPPWNSAPPNRVPRLNPLAAVPSEKWIVLLLLCYNLPLKASHRCYTASSSIASHSIDSPKRCLRNPGRFTPPLLSQRLELPNLKTISSTVELPSSSSSQKFHGLQQHTLSQFGIAKSDKGRVRWLVHHIRTTSSCLSPRLLLPIQKRISSTLEPRQSHLSLEQRPAPGHGRFTVNALLL